MCYEMNITTTPIFIQYPVGPNLATILVTASWLILALILIACIVSYIIYRRKIKMEMKRQFQLINDESDVDLETDVV